MSSLVPLLLVERGELLIHAAAVRTDAGAVVICGPSGRGKSTLAAALDLMGLPLLAEDVLAVSVENDAVLAWPGPLDTRVDQTTNARLGPRSCPDTTIRGKRLRPGGHGHGAEPVSVIAVVSLEPREPTPLDVRRLPPAEAMAWVFPSVLRLERETWPAAYSRLAELLRRVPSYRARLRDDLAAAPDEAIELIDRITRARGPRLTAACGPRGPWIR